MDYSTYQKHVVARASNSFHGDKLSAREFATALLAFISAGSRLDAIKKTLMYDRDYRDLHVEPMSSDLNCAQLLGELEPQEQQLIHAILGFATEGVELVEALYERCISYQPFDYLNLQEEFGDGEWYRALGLHALGQTHEANLEQNDAKLEKRYGPVDAGFTYKSANERNLEGERAILEGKGIVQLSQCGGPDQLAGDCCLDCYRPVGRPHADDCKTQED